MAGKCYYVFSKQVGCNTDDTAGPLAEEDVFMCNVCLQAEDNAFDVGNAFGQHFTVQVGQAVCLDNANLKEILVKNHTATADAKVNIFGVKVEIIP